MFQSFNNQGISYGGCFRLCLLPFRFCIRAQGYASPDIDAESFHLMQQHRRVTNREKSAGDLNGPQKPP